MEKLLKLVPAIAYCNEEDWSIICRASFTLENGEEEIFKLTNEALNEMGYIPEFLTQHGTVKETCSLKYYFNMKYLPLVKLAEVVMKYNPQVYEKWHKERIEECAKITNIYYVSDIAKLVYEIHCMNYIYYENVWYMRVYDRWEKIRAPPVITNETLRKIPCLERDETLRMFVKRKAIQNHLRKELEECFWVSSMEEY